ncbi:hypothetical protein AVEN_106703-1 [Araneus ventricosus]|uniref:Uncharacterized protein n=1 Tax=Araneus ventricosus TaxID=182803 RepID=A0A4Y2F1R7_ARAVE|nr:hypothetical protein AVEN_106703-1 [Araneus ventricosus]
MHPWPKKTARLRQIKHYADTLKQSHFRKLSSRILCSLSARDNLRIPLSSATEERLKSLPAPSPLLGHRHGLKTDSLFLRQLESTFWENTPVLDDGGRHSHGFPLPQAASIHILGEYSGFRRRQHELKCHVLDELIVGHEDVHSYFAS